MQRLAPLTLRRSELRALRARAWEMARARYEDSLASLTEIAESRGVEAALAWDPRAEDGSRAPKNIEDGASHG